MGPTTFHIERLSSSQVASVCRLSMVHDGRRTYLTKGWVSHADAVAAYNKVRDALDALSPLLAYETIAPSTGEWRSFNEDLGANR